ncbi:MAG: hypothetical protein AB9872_17510 [Solidesulfovibrio sp.]
MKNLARFLVLLAVLALPALGIAAEPTLVTQAPPPQDQIPATTTPLPPKTKRPEQPKAPLTPLKSSAPGTVIVPQRSVVAPPGSIILPPGSTPHEPGPSARRRASVVARCSQQQAECNTRCNNSTYGQTQNLCYKQCKSMFTHCAARANAQP